MAHPTLEGRYRREPQTQTANKKEPPMNATSHFSLGLARASESNVETTDCLLSRQVLQRIATRMSLVSEAIGLSVLGILIIVNRHQADLNDFAGGSSVAMIDGISGF
jgi:hypothetical protein